VWYWDFTPEAAPDPLEAKSHDSHRLPDGFFLSANLAIDVGLGENQKIQILKGWGAVVDPDGDCKFAENQGKLTSK
jgi:hypothetical protein